MQREIEEIKQKLDNNEGLCGLMETARECSAEAVGAATEALKAGDSENLATDIIADLRDTAVLRAKVIRKVLEVDGSDSLACIDDFIDGIAE